MAWQSRDMKTFIAAITHAPILPLILRISFGFNFLLTASCGGQLRKRRLSVQHMPDHDELNEIEASGGIKEHGVRYVLGISLLLAVSLLSLMWIFGALTN